MDRQTVPRGGDWALPGPWPNRGCPEPRGWQRCPVARCLAVRLPVAVRAPGRAPFLLPSSFPCCRAEASWACLETATGATTARLELAAGAGLSGASSGARPCSGRGGAAPHYLACRGEAAGCCSLTARLREPSWVRWCRSDGGMKPGATCVCREIVTLQLPSLTF